jgi:hypothetical protein
LSSLFLQGPHPGTSTLLQESVVPNLIMTDFCTGLGRSCFDELPGGAMLVAVHRTVEVLKG